MNILKLLWRKVGIQSMLPYVLFGFCLAISVCACVKDVDFDQVDDLILTPVYDIDFIYAAVDIETLITQNDDSSTILPEVIANDTLDYDFLENDFVTDNIVQVTLTFEFENTIEKGFDFNFQFLNSENQPIDQSYTIPVLPGAGVDALPVVTRRDIILDRAAIVALSTAEKLTSSIRVEEVSRDLTGNIILKSKALYFVSYQF